MKRIWLWVGSSLLAISTGLDVQAQSVPADATLTRGVELYVNGEFDLSRSVLEEVLRRQDLESRERAKVHLYLGFNDAAADRLDSARTHLERALRLDPALRFDRESLTSSVGQMIDALRPELRG